MHVPLWQSIRSLYPKIAVCTAPHLTGTMELVTLIPPSPNWFQSGVRPRGSPITIHCSRPTRSLRRCRSATRRRTAGRCSPSPRARASWCSASPAQGAWPCVWRSPARPGARAHTSFRQRAATEADPRDAASREGDPVVLCVLCGHKASAKLSAICFVGSAAAAPLCASAGSDTQVLLWSAARTTSPAVSRPTRARNSDQNHGRYPLDRDVEAQKVLKSHKEHGEAVALLAAPRTADDCHHLLSLDESFELVDWDTLRCVATALVAWNMLFVVVRAYASAFAPAATSGASGGCPSKVCDSQQSNSRVSLAHRSLMDRGGRGGAPGVGGSPALRRRRCLPAGGGHLMRARVAGRLARGHRPRRVERARGRRAVHRPPPTRPVLQGLAPHPPRHIRARRQGAGVARGRDRRQCSACGGGRGHPASAGGREGRRRGGLCGRAQPHRAPAQPAVDDCAVDAAIWRRRRPRAAHVLLPGRPPPLAPPSSRPALPPRRQWRCRAAGAAGRAHAAAGGAQPQRVPNRAAAGAPLPFRRQGQSAVGPQPPRGGARGRHRLHGPQRGPAGARGARRPLSRASTIFPSLLLALTSHHLYC